MTTDGNTRLCSATRRDGQPCAGPALPAGPLCFAHSPQFAERLRASRVAGGKGSARTARASKLLPASLRPLLALLLQSATEVHDGDLTPQQASALAAVAGAACKVLNAGQLEERLAALEAAYSATERRTA